jgi:hypothetical protein
MHPTDGTIGHSDTNHSAHFHAKLSSLLSTRWQLLFHPRYLPALSLAVCTDIGRHALREAIVAVRRKHPFAIDAFVLLPDHFHCILTLPEADADFPKRWRLIKLMVTKTAKEELALPARKETFQENSGEKAICGSDVT